MLITVSMDCLVNQNAVQRLHGMDKSQSQIMERARWKKMSASPDLQKIHRSCRRPAHAFSYFSLGRDVSVCCYLFMGFSSALLLLRIILLFCLLFLLISAFTE